MKSIYSFKTFNPTSDERPVDEVVKLKEELRSEKDKVRKMVNHMDTVQRRISNYIDFIQKQ